MSTYHYRLFSSLLKLSPIFNFLLKNQKKISLIVEHTMEWRRKKRWETIYSLKETSSAQPQCIETSQSCIIFQYFKNLCKTRQNIEESVVLFAKILAFTVYPGVLPFLIRKRGTPCPRNCLLSGSTNKSWYHLNQQQSSRVVYVLNTLTKIRSKLLRGMR